MILQYRNRNLWAISMNFSAFSKLFYTPLQFRGSHGYNCLEKELFLFFIFKMGKLKFCQVANTACHML